MNYYCDIQLRADPDFVPAILLNALFSKLHRFLTEHPDLNIGVSFPGYSTKPRTLGSQMRLHGNQADISALQNATWLTGMQDHVDCTAVTPVPASSQHMQVRRMQTKSSPERLARRYSKRHQVSEADALRIYQTVKPGKLPLPFLTLNSDSTGQRFILFIEQSASQPDAVSGSFNRYGLSQMATVPWF